MTDSFLPVLSRGAHSDPREGACLMEYVSLIAGVPWSDNPACTHPVLAAAARQVNDHLADAERQTLVPLIPRLIGTADLREDDADRAALTVRLAVWAARQTLDSWSYDVAEVLRDALGTAEAWCDGRPAEYLRLDLAAAAAKDVAKDAHAANAAGLLSGAHALATAAANNAVAAAAHASAGHPDFYWCAAAAAHSIADAVNAAVLPGERVSLLTGLLDEYDRLTGRNTTPDVDLAQLRTALAEATR